MKKLSLKEIYESLKEDLIKTHPYETSVEILKRADYKVIDDHDDVGKKIFVAEVGQSDAKFRKLIHNLGWFMSGMYIYNAYYESFEYRPYTKQLHKKLEDNDIVFAIILSAKYGEEVDIKSSKFEYSDYPYLYHATPRQYVDKIKKIGLTPKTKNKKAIHPDRVYFSKTIELAQNLIPQLAQFSEPDYKTNQADYAVLKIDSKKLPPDTKFYDDPDMSGGAVYILGNVPPNAIVSIGYWDERIGTDDDTIWVKKS